LHAKTIIPRIYWCWIHVLLHGIWYLYHYLWIQTITQL
jgi:hypothetical protein